MKKIDTYLIFDIILALLGIYLIVTSFLMRRQGRVSTLLISEDEQKKCKKQKEYVAFMFPRMLAFAVVCTLVGAVGIINDLKLIVIPYWGMIELGVFLVAFFVFYTQMRDARLKFL